MGKGTNRNYPCHCGSGKKYKVCCYFKDQGYMQKVDVFGNSTWVKKPHKISAEEAILGKTK